MNVCNAGQLTGPLEFLRRDLMAINIQRGRDHGIPDYNTARVHYGLSRVSDWAEINPVLNSTNPEIIERLAEVYSRNIDDVDVWPAGLLESVNAKKQPGALFQAVTKDQFRRIRDGDRYYYENKLNGSEWLTHSTCDTKLTVFLLNLEVVCAGCVRL